MRSLHLVAAVVVAGCGLTADPVADCVKPSIAVMKFDSRAAFGMGWDLGDGMRDVLVDRLVETGRFHVIERPELEAVVREIQLQHSGVTRKHRRAAMGRLKNVEYLIKGTITDFGHVSAKRKFLGLANWDVLGGSHRAVVGMTLYVVEVESGEIVASESLEDSVRAGDLTVKATYPGVAFGGSTFYETPLGRATRSVIDKAVKRVSRTIEARPWQPKVALVQESYKVIINGGKNRGVQLGAEYEVLEMGQPIQDPDTGDVIGHSAGQPVGRVRVSRVAKRYSVADVVTGSIGDFKVGQQCRRAATPVARANGRN